MCSNTWPSLGDLTRDESKRILRRLELDAYASVLSAFRAQGDLNKEKKKMLHDFQNYLGISTERHRAEIRRVVNDEKLTTIADKMSGPDVSSEWQHEGRRLVPLMPRLVPQTAFSVTANNLASLQAGKSLNMPPPSSSLSSTKDGLNLTSPGSSINSMPTNKATRSASPNSNVVVLPSGMSIHIKGGLNADDEEIHGKRRRSNSSSTEGVVVTRTTPPVAQLGPQPGPKIPPTPPSSLHGISQMKQGLIKSPIQAKSATPLPSTQKVIIVSSATHTQSVVQKSISVPAVKTNTATTSMLTHPRTSVVMPSNVNNSMAQGQPGSVQTYVTNQGTYVARPRTRTIATRGRVPQVSRTGMMVQQGSAAHIQHATQQGNMQNIQIKPVSKPTIHIKQEGSMKIITQGAPGTGGKILPKPGPSGHVVMVTSQATGSVMSRPLTAGASTKVVNIGASGGRVISSTRPSVTNVVTVNPKTLQFTTVRGSSGATILSTANRVGGKATVLSSVAGGKPNVIVVQKAGAKRAVASGNVKTQGAQSLNSPYEKELLSFIQRQDTQKHVQGQRILTADGKTITRTGMIPRKITVVRQKSDGESSQATGTPSRTSLLAELIHAAGIPGEGHQIVQSDGGHRIIHADPQVAGDNMVSIVTSSSGDVVQTSEISEDSQAIASIQEYYDQEQEQQNPEQNLVQNQWVEYDMPVESNVQIVSGDNTNASAIKALLDLQSGQQQQQIKPGVQRLKSVDANNSQMMQSEIITIDSSGHIISKQQVAKGDEARYVNQTLGKHQIVETSLAPSYTTETVQIMSDTGEQLQEQIIGELDPQTGILYTNEALDSEQVIVSDSYEIPQSVADIVQGIPQSMTGIPQTVRHIPQTIREIPQSIGGIPQTVREIPHSIAGIPQTVREIPQSAVGIPHSVVGATNTVTATETIVASKIDSIKPISGSSKHVIYQHRTPQSTLSSHKVLSTSQSLSSATNNAVSNNSKSASFSSSSVSLLKEPANSGAKPVDFLTSALSQAQINLDPYEFIEDDSNIGNIQTSQSVTGHVQMNQSVTGNIQIPQTAKTNSESRSSGLVSILPSQPVVVQNQSEISMDNVTVLQDQNGSGQSLVQEAENYIEQPLQDSQLDSVNAQQSIQETVLLENVVTETIDQQPESFQTISQDGDAPPTVFTSNQIAAQIVNANELPQSANQQADVVPSHGQPQVARTAVQVSSSAVAVEHGGLDISNMKLEDFSSQKLDGSEVVYYDDGGVGDANENSMRQPGNRKRKISVSAPEMNTQNHTGGNWTRLAQNLIGKIWRFRGSHKEKGEMNAASWFIRPVNPAEVPDYYNIIKNPMDFSTIKKKLESGSYSYWDDFNADMQLVRTNCMQYNPPGTEVRRDCDEVFNYYNAEYEKVISKWNQMIANSGAAPQVKKPKTLENTMPLHQS